MEMPTDMESGLVPARDVYSVHSGTPLAASQRRSWISRCTSICCPCHFPDSVTNIKDWLHLVLVIGLVTAAAIVILEAVFIFSNLNCGSPLCFRQWACAILMSPSVYEFFKFVRNHDKSLQESKQQLLDSVNHLQATYEQANSELKDLVKDFANNAQFYVHMGFKSSREHFNMFIENIRNFRKDLYKEEELLWQLRCFTIQWLKVFQQTLLQSPNWLNMEELEIELQNCRTIDDLCNKIQQYIKDLPDTPCLTSVTEAPALEDVALPTHDSGTSVLQCNCFWRTWEQCGRQSTSFPLKMSFCIFSVTILSRRHLHNISYLVIDLCLLGLEILEMEWRILGLVGVNLICVVSMLICFGQIDEIMQLQEKANFYERKCTKINELSKKSKEQWAQVQQRHKLWRQRTVPSLAILEKVHNELDNRSNWLVNGASYKDDRAVMLENFNKAWKHANERLGDAEDWMESGQSSLLMTARESIGGRLNVAGNEKNVAEIVNKLDDVTKDSNLLPALADGTQYAFCSTTSS